MKLRELCKVSWTATVNLFTDNGFQLAAALSFYAVLSLAPSLLFLLAMLGLFADREAVGGELVEQMREMAGDSGAQVTTTILKQAAEPQHGTFAGIAGLVVLVVGASGFFVQLQDAVNTIWGVKPRPGRRVWSFLRGRLVSLGMLLCVAFLLLVSLFLSAGLVAFHKYASEWLPGAAGLWRGVDAAVSIALFTVLFSAMFKALPDVVIAWHDVWVGGFVTSILFALGKLLIGLYLAYSAVGSAYGAAGSIVIVLVWVYYSSLILLLGAEFTHAYAVQLGHGVRPASSAVTAAE